MDKSGISYSVRNSSHNVLFGTDDEDAPTPRLASPVKDTDLGNETVIPPEAFGDASLMDDACQYVDLVFVYILLRTPIKRCLESIARSPGTEELVHANGTKRVKEKSVHLIPSYTDPSDVLNFLPLSEINPDDIDGVPVTQRVAVVLPTRPLVRRATDFPMPPPSPTHVLTPRSARTVLENVLEVPITSDPVELWRRYREDHSCPICLKVLVRPVDVGNCGHYVCRTHVLDMYQHGGCKKGIRCSVCRKEQEVPDFNAIEIDQKMWSKILRAKFHPAKRRSVSPSRSLTPLRDRFNRTFLKDEDF